MTNCLARGYPKSSIPKPNTTPTSGRSSTRVALRCELHLVDGASLDEYPTLELLAPDCCTRLDDGIGIAALYRVLVRHLYLNRPTEEGVDGVHLPLLTPRRSIAKPGLRTVGR